jgi:hypothetical protein
MRSRRRRRLGAQGVKVCVEPWPPLLPEIDNIQLGGDVSRCQYMSAESLSSKMLSKHIVRFDGCSTETVALYLRRLTFQHK